MHHHLDSLAQQVVVFQTIKIQYTIFQYSQDLDNYKILQKRAIR